MDSSTFWSAFESEIEKLAVRYAEELRAGKLSPGGKQRLGLSGPNPSLHEARQGPPALEEAGKGMGRTGLGPVGSNAFQTTRGVAVRTLPGQVQQAQVLKRKRAMEKSMEGMRSAPAMRITSMHRLA